VQEDAVVDKYGHLRTSEVLILDDIVDGGGDGDDGDSNRNYKRAV